ncbi:hypothetical protein P378_19780 [Desulforamulus profundi]|uniref:Uncharacterized protein n=1 Tax=Desulforamulus profundi TaxID=1383067 RepID=A0A2C6M3Y7_9FIRM|nr:prepilin-type N-terminal cleavage/methylation domain-containing protein [Desulforamulus profundi]PHJ36857.1 hypothetical protein P378_19780 [Desulforamulus profundi]
MLNVKSRLSEKKGLTLVEILVATSLLAMVILAVSNVLITGLVAANSAKEQTIAVNLAQAIMEERLATADPGNSVPRTPIDQKPGFENYKGYYYEVAVDNKAVIKSSNGTTNDTNFYSITVKVYYLDQNNNQPKNTVSLYTIKRKG